MKERDRQIPRKRVKTKEKNKDKVKSRNMKKYKKEVEELNPGDLTEEAVMVS